MPEIGRIQSTNFQALLTRLGITRNNVPFSLRSEVLPVVLVGGEVTFLASPTPPYGVTDWFTTGVQTAPVADFVMADTGPLPVGPYTLLMSIYSEDQKDFGLEWRNAGNTANLRSQRFSGLLHEDNVNFSARFQIENENERLRVLIVDTGTVATNYQVSLFVRI